MNIKKIADEMSIVASAARDRGGAVSWEMVRDWAYSLHDLHMSGEPYAWAPSKPSNGLDWACIRRSRSEYFDTPVYLHPAPIPPAAYATAMRELGAAEVEEVIADIRRAADNGGANEGHCYGWFRVLNQAFPAPTCALATRPTPEAQEARDAARLRYVCEHNWIGAKTRCERGIMDSDIASLRAAIDAALALPAQGEGENG